MICHDTVRGFFDKKRTKLPQGCVHDGGEILKKKNINKPTSQQFNVVRYLDKEREIKLQSDIPNLLEEYLLMLPELLEGLAPV